MTYLKNYTPNYCEATFIAAGEACAEATTDKKRDDRSYSILLAEDFQPFRIFVTSLLSGNGYVLHEASDGLEAVTKAQQLQPDLILLDIHLPKLNGLEVARRLCKLVPS